MVREAAGHVVERGLLMGTQAEQLAPERDVFRLTANQIGPIEGPAGEVAETQH